MNVGHNSRPSLGIARPFFGWILADIPKCVRIKFLWVELVVCKKKHVPHRSWKFKRWHMAIKGKKLHVLNLGWWWTRAWNDAYTCINMNQRYSLSIRIPPVTNSRGMPWWWPCLMAAMYIYPMFPSCIPLKLYWTPSDGKCRTKMSPPKKKTMVARESNGQTSTRTSANLHGSRYLRLRVSWSNVA